MTAPAARYPITVWPHEERPRERLETLGPRALSSRELLALIIQTGRPAEGGRAARTAIDLAGDLLRAYAPEGGESLRRIMTASAGDVGRRVPGVGPAKAAKILAALELGRRASEEARPERERVRNGRDVYERLRGVLRDLPYEEFHVLLLNTQNEVLRDVSGSSGTLDETVVHSREVFRAAIVEGAASVVLVHNHPSGDPTPSAADHAITAQLRRAGDAVGIPLVDHVVIGEGRYVSFVEAGLWVT